MKPKTLEFTVNPRYDEADKWNRDRWMKENSRFTVRAATIENAASIAARRITGKRNVDAHRMTGDRGKSGCFQIATSAPGGGTDLSAHYFHVG
jgi:hypothetical protein